VSGNGGLRVAHINVRSFVPYPCLGKLGCGIRPSLDPSIDNYVLVCSDRSIGRRGDGIVLYINESLQFFPIGLDVPPVGTLTDTVAVSLHLARDRQVAVTCVYRHPSAPSSDLHFIKSYLSCACITDAIICLDNFNVNILGQIDCYSPNCYSIASLFFLGN